MTRAAQADSPGFASIVDGGILRRAALVALVMGSILTLTNQSAAIFGVEEFGYLRLALAYLTPLVVIAVSQILGVQRAMIDRRQNGGRRLVEETVLATALGHGIPLRTVVVGFLAGSINALVIAAIALSEGAGLNSLPVVVVAQAYALPLIFGLLSQTIAYRSTI